MTIELYVFPPSPRAFKAMSVANHLGLDWTMHEVDPRSGNMRTPDYVLLNPNMRMPTVRHGDFVLWEANAICQYLASLRPDAGLLPADELGRLDVTRWQFWDLAHWEQACMPFMLENVVKPGFLGITERDEAALAKGAELFHRAASVLDGQLARRRYVTGDRLTLADFSLGAALIYAGAAQLPLEPYGEIRRWYAELSVLPAWQQTVGMAMAPQQVAA
ncbi:MAG: glutathione S-transferase family protein [Rhodospirillales bacterium]